MVIFSPIYRKSGMVLAKLMVYSHKYHKYGAISLCIFVKDSAGF